MSTIAERVQAGVKFLDEHDPGWWKEDVERAIDLKMLMLSSSADCVLGQRCPLEVLATYLETDADELSAIDLGDAYNAYAERLSGLRGASLAYWARDHGFTFLSAGHDYVGTWDDLTAEWERVISGRRAAA